VLQGFAGDGLVGVDEAKSGGSRTPGVSEVGKVFTLGNVDGDFTTLGVVFFILSAFVLGALLDTKSLHGGIEKLGETFGVEALVADPNSLCNLWVWEESAMVVCGWTAEGAAALLLLKVGKSWRWDSSVGVDDDEHIMD
jgi:hypothetical protein